MTKIGHFVSFGIGGADRATIELIKELSKQVPDIQICYNDMSFPMRTEDQDSAQPLLNIQNEYEGLGTLRRISETSDLADLKLDILHTHRSGEDEWLLPGLGDIERKFKIVETNFHGFRNTPADYRIYPSRELTKFRGIKPSGNHSVIANIVNSIPGRSLKQDLGIPQERLVYGRVGRSDKSIYSSVLLRQYSRVESDRTALIWVGASAQAMKDAEVFGVRNVTWIDPVEDPNDMADLYATFDVYCHANPLGETFGNTVAEAVLRGIPVASLKGSHKYPQAQKELLNKPQFCSTARGYRSLLRKYRDDPEFRENESKINSAFASENLDPRRIADEVINVYEKILA